MKNPLAMILISISTRKMIVNTISPTHNIESFCSCHPQSMLIEGLSDPKAPTYNVCSTTMTTYMSNT